MLEALIGEVPAARPTSPCCCSQAIDFPDEEAATAAAASARLGAADDRRQRHVRRPPRGQPSAAGAWPSYCGAGINCVGVAPDGRQVRFPSLGEISGDWGGGQDVGLAALWAAARSEDGRGPRTSLERLVPAHFGLDTPRELARALHFGRVAERELASSRRSCSPRPRRRRRAARSSTASRPRSWRWRAPRSRGSA